MVAIGPPACLQKLSLECTAWVMKSGSRFTKYRNTTEWWGPWPQVALYLCISMMLDLLISCLHFAALHSKQTVYKSFTDQKSSLALYFLPLIFDGHKKAPLAVRRKESKQSFIDTELVSTNFKFIDNNITRFVETVNDSCIIAKSLPCIGHLCQGLESRPVNSSSQCFT